MSHSDNFFEIRNMWYVDYVSACYSTNRLGLCALAANSIHYREERSSIVVIVFFKGQNKAFVLPCSIVICNKVLVHLEEWMSSIGKPRFVQKLHFITNFTRRRGKVRLFCLLLKMPIFFLVSYPPVGSPDIKKKLWLSKIFSAPPSKSLWHKSTPKGWLIDSRLVRRLSRFLLCVKMLFFLWKFFRGKRERGIP